MIISSCGCGMIMVIVDENLQTKLNDSCSMFQGHSNVTLWDTVLCTLEQLDDQVIERTNKWTIDHRNNKTNVQTTDICIFREHGFFFNLFCKVFFLHPDALTCLYNLKNPTTSQANGYLPEKLN